MQTCEDGSATFTIDERLTRDVRARADRAGVAPDDLVEIAIRRGLDELEMAHVAATTGERRRDGAMFFDWSR